MSAIDGVVVTALRRIGDPRGAVLHMLRCDSPLFRRFGEVYFSLVRPGAVKPWRRHREMILNLAVPIGTVRMVLYDDRDGSPTAGALIELDTGEENYALVTVPPGVWSAFRAISAIPALVANCASLPHDDAEVERVALDDPRIPYSWTDGT